MKEYSMRSGLVYNFKGSGLVYNKENV